MKYINLLSEYEYETRPFLHNCVMNKKSTSLWQLINIIFTHLQRHAFMYVSRYAQIYLKRIKHSIVAWIYIFVISHIEILKVFHNIKPQHRLIFSNQSYYECCSFILIFQQDTCLKFLDINLHKNFKFGKYTVSMYEFIHSFLGF